MNNNWDNELAAVLAHEVKNPVAIIKINLDYIRTYLPKEVYKNMEVIDNALLRIDRVIEGYRLMSVDTSDNELIYIEDMLNDIIEDYNITAD
ncbi:MAG: histidine kinase dimerization/phospho-acceptor domain-containing protein, partial [Lachnospirales bacterium]